MKEIKDLKAYLSGVQDGDKAYEFLSGINESSRPGSYIINENVFINVMSYQTKTGFDGVFESHREYTDVHVMIKGGEKIFYGDKKDMSVVKEYDGAEDYELLRGENYAVAEYFAPCGTEFKENEPHMAGFAAGEPETVLKAVIKIKSV